MSFWVDVLGWIPSRLRAVPKGAAVALASGGNAGKGRTAAGFAARALSSVLGSRNSHPRAVAACWIVALYCATVPIMFTASGTEITCELLQSSVSATPAAAFATIGAP